MTPDTNSETTPPIPPTNPPVAAPAPPVPHPVLGYCRGCGIPLTTENVRYAMGTMYCPEHAPAGTAAADNPYSVPPSVPPQSMSNDSNAALAFFLGLIPGVGAIYNGQYAKGLLHVVVFGFVIALQDADSQMPVLTAFLIPAFIFYMAFEAMHMAKRRREGLPVDEFSSIAPLGASSGLPVGPVILMALGVFFLLSNLGMISVREMLRWWPVGLIAMGAYMLYARLTEGRRVQ